METEVSKVIPFLDVFIDIHDNILNKITSINRLILVYYLILTVLLFSLIDCAYKINNTWASFHNVTKIKENLKHNSFPPFLIDKITKSCLDKVHRSSDQSNPESNETFLQTSVHWKIFRASSEKAVKNL